MLDRIRWFLLIPKNRIEPIYKEKLGSYENQIINFLRTIRPMIKPTSSQQQGSAEIDLSQSEDKQMMLPMRQRQMQIQQFLQKQQLMQLHQRQHELSFSQQQQPAKRIKTDESPQLHLNGRNAEVNMRQEIDVNPEALQDNLPIGQLRGYSLKPSVNPIIFQAQSAPSFSTQLTPSSSSGLVKLLTITAVTPRYGFEVIKMRKSAVKGYTR